MAAAEREEDADGVVIWIIACSGIAPWTLEVSGPAAITTKEEEEENNSNSHNPIAVANADR